MLNIFFKYLYQAMYFIFLYSSIDLRYIMPIQIIENFLWIMLLGIQIFNRITRSPNRNEFQA